jgi:hypothetical protein
MVTGWMSAATFTGMGIHVEERMASLVAATGVVWTTKLATANFVGLDAFSFFNLPRGPLEVCAAAILVWLHAKWRRSVRAA